MGNIIYNKNIKADYFGENLLELIKDKFSRENWNERKLSDGELVIVRDQDGKNARLAVMDQDEGIAFIGEKGNLIPADDSISIEAIGRNLTNSIRVRIWEDPEGDGETKKNALELREGGLYVSPITEVLDPEGKPFDITKLVGMVQKNSKDISDIKDNIGELSLSILKLQNEIDKGVNCGEY